MATYSSRESHGWRNLVGHGPWGRRESDMTEVTKHRHTRRTILNLLTFPSILSCILPVSVDTGVSQDSWLLKPKPSPVHPKGNQPWIFIGRTDAEAEAPLLWPPDVKSWLIWEDPDVGKDWRQGEKGMAEDEMVGWHHRLSGHKSEQTPGHSEGQGSLEYCSP